MCFALNVFLLYNLLTFLILPLIFLSSPSSHHHVAAQCKCTFKCNYNNIDLNIEGIGLYIGSFCLLPNPFQQAYFIFRPTSKNMYRIATSLKLSIWTSLYILCDLDWIKYTKIKIKKLFERFLEGQLRHLKAKNHSAQLITIFKKSR